MNKPPRYVYYALRDDEEVDFGFSAIGPEQAVEPAEALLDKGLPLGGSQFIFATASCEAALFFAESGKGPGFARPCSKTRSRPKRVVAKIDLSAFKGEVIDVSTAAGCEHYGLKRESKAWEFAIDLQMVLLVGYVHPRLYKSFDLEANPLPHWGPPNAQRAASFDTFSASLTDLHKRIIQRDWVGDSGNQRLTFSSGHQVRDAQGLASDDCSRGSVSWENKHRLEEEMRKLTERRRRMELQLEIVRDREIESCRRAFMREVARGRICEFDEYRILEMKNWICEQEHPFAASAEHSELWLSGTFYSATIAMYGTAARESACRIAQTQKDGCQHCSWTQPAEFQLMRNVARDGPNPVWPPYYQLFSFDPETQSLDTILNTMNGACIRDSRHPHVFPTDEVGFAFPLQRLPTALSALEATLPRLDAEDTSEVTLPQRPLYLVLAVPKGVPQMRASNHSEAPLSIPKLEAWD
jgi:hypothetical protein